MLNANPLLFSHYDVTFQEVPNEVSLVFEITGCPHKCKGCHSPFLWDYHGFKLKECIEPIIKKYEGMITCVCFMGGDQNPEELTRLCKLAHDHGLKTCIYSGLPLSEFMKLFDDSLICIDYFKVGPYIQELGGLDKEATNQSFWKVEHTTNNFSFQNITKLFQGKSYEDYYKSSMDKAGD